MFLTVDDAKVELAEILDPPRLELFLPLLQPSVQLVAASDAAPGTSQIGGRPRAAPGLVWPAVDAASLLPGTLDAGSAPANAENRAHVAAGVPMSFVASIDLPKAALIPQLGALPDQGRLFLFYDFRIGPYENSPEVGRVIWDRSEEPLTEIAPPEALIRAAEALRAETRALNAKYDLGEDWDGFGTLLEIAPRPAAFQAGFDLPSPYAMLPDNLSAELGRIIPGREDLSDDEYETYDQYQQAYDLQTEIDDAAPLRLMSAPQPVQDDPRLEAGAIALFGNRSLTFEEWQQNKDAITVAARDWITLAQIDIASWLQQSGEGLVYVLINKDDLAAARFDRVIFIYQQS